MPILTIVRGAATVVLDFHLSSAEIGERYSNLKTRLDKLQDGSAPGYGLEVAATELRQWTAFHILLWGGEPGARYVLTAFASGHYSRATHGLQVLIQIADAVDVPSMTANDNPAQLINPTPRERT